MDRVRAVRSLLEDPDPTTRDSLHQRLLADDELFAEVWAEAVAAERIPPLLEAVAIRRESDALAERCARPIDLESGLWGLERIRLPLRLDEAAGRARLDGLAASLSIDAGPGGAAGELLRRWGFAGDRHQYHDPRNAVLGPCLERRAGLPLTLTALWIALCRRRNWQAWAAALPGHVIGGWAGGWVDCFAGRPIGLDEIAALCLRSGVVDPRPYLQPATDRALLARAARNLTYGYRLQNDQPRAAAAYRLAKVLARPSAD